MNFLLCRLFRDGDFGEGLRPAWNRMEWRFLAVKQSAPSPRGRMPVSAERMLRIESPER